MTGRRARRLIAEDMGKRYQSLSQFLACYLHEDVRLDYGTPEKAIDAAINDYPVELRQQVRPEVRSLLAEKQDDVELRTALNDGLGVRVYFKEAQEARKFAEEVERKLLASIEENFQQQRK
jgi:hypothetical protein